MTSTITKTKVESVVLRSPHIDGDLEDDPQAPEATEDMS